MTHVVTAARAAVRAGLMVAMPGVNWARDHWARVDATQLPRGGVGTPRVMTELIDVEAVARSIDIVVLLKREASGSEEDLEDDLDADSVSIEEAVLPILATLTDTFELVETRTSVDADGRRAVGELTMLFRLVLRTDEGNPE